MLAAIDNFLMDGRPRKLAGLRRGSLEFLYFGIKEARSCLFVALFFACVLLMPRAGIAGIPRYDLLLIAAVVIQAWMLRARLETWDELKAVCLFHVVGFALEAFKVSGTIRSWSYPDFAYTKFYGVPLFAGFMYAAVGSYIVQAWRLFDLRIRHHPVTGWRRRLRSSSTPISSRIITLAITAGIWPPARSGFIRAPR